MQRKTYSYPTRKKPITGVRLIEILLIKPIIWTGKITIWFMMLVLFSPLILLNYALKNKKGNEKFFSHYNPCKSNRTNNSKMDIRRMSGDELSEIIREGRYY